MILRKALFFNLRSDFWRSNKKFQKGQPSWNEANWNLFFLDSDHIRLSRIDQFLGGHVQVWIALSQHLNGGINSILRATNRKERDL